MSKNIVFCADGTWNSPSQDENHDQLPDQTNVYKLFRMLEGELSAQTPDNSKEQEKVLTSGTIIRQVAKYLHGVGDDSNALTRLLGGAFGAGVITRIVRGYTFISRNYKPGDRIFILGFSRGAYTARALAGFIASQGLLSPSLAANKEDAYRAGAQAWYRYRDQCARPDFCARLAEVATNLPAFITRASLEATDFAAVPEIAAVAVWDTVGALGIPLFVGDARMDAFRFCDTKLSDKVTWGLHALALDERRCDFTPTLWDTREQIKQVLFPGAHADVGGGYPTLNTESNLSDGALEWILEELLALGLIANDLAYPDFFPSVGGVAHQPWRGTLYKTAARAFPEDLVGHHSLALRTRLTEVQSDPGAAAAPYRPENLPRDICTVGLDPVTPDTAGICARCVLRD
ncbi:hypothetical protein GMLC_03050 [Geomonas limicola]|uniref:T6SS Phospholipase effector Tle1-like catalytic domain-containing protein n=1 Tax=Geomonas limicola TaxID=2740186 RepID=A0A6V8N2K6_9BACT|nr:DUF2235 domain-containing protein [Geomonas limicola]GFO66726.1 hypothetical protein GMLC_03050 [Geomonas limicola]